LEEYKRNFCSVLNCQKKGRASNRKEVILRVAEKQKQEEAVEKQV